MMRAKNRPLRIAYLDQTGEMGGAEHLLLDLMTGVPCDAVVPVLLCAEEGHFPQSARARGIETHIIPLPRFLSLSRVVKGRKSLDFRAVFRNVRIMRQCIDQTTEAIQAHSIDIVQTNSAFAHLYGGFAARRLQRPCIWYFHDLIETQRMRGNVARFWRMAAYRLATRVVCVSQAVWHGLQGIPHGSVIYAGCSSPSMGKTEGDATLCLPILPKEAIRVGFIGRIAYVKALDVLIAAASRIVTQNPNVHFFVFGEALFGQSDYKQTLMEQVCHQKLENHWHWMGYVENVQGAISAMDILTLPSRREALPLVLMEIALAGKAVVASRVGGIPEIVQHSKTGLLISPGSVDQLESALLDLLQNPEKAAEMGRNAKALIERTFPPEKYFAEWLKLYEALL